MSPSQEELAELGGGERALPGYTRQVMETYAKNFTLKGGGEVQESELVWAATVHRERQNRGTDVGRQGEKKAGCKPTCTCWFRPVMPPSG